jgi:hypothetical protein
VVSSWNGRFAPHETHRLEPPGVLCPHEEQIMMD